MEISMRSKNRKPIFGRKENSPQSNMYQSTPHFFKGPAHLKAKPVDYHSRIIYGPRTSMPVHAHSVAKTAKPITITVCPPNRPQSVNSRPQPQIIHHQPNFINDRVSPTMVKSAYTSHNFGPQVVVRSVGQNQPLLKRSMVYRQPQEMRNSVVRRGDVRATVVAVERVMKPLHENQDGVERQLTVFKPHHQTHSQYFDVREPQELKSYQEIQRKVQKPDLNSNSSDKMHKLSIMNQMLASNYNELYDELQDLKGELGSKEVIEDELFIKKAQWELENIFNLQLLQAMNKMQQIDAIYREASPNRSTLKKGHHQSSSSFYR